MGKILGTGMRGGTIEGDYESKGVVHLKNDSGLRGACKEAGFSAVAAQVKSNFKFLFKKELDISQESIAFEIVGHLVPNDIAKYLSAVPGASSIIKSTDVIDIGISEHDDNRWVWDTLAALYSPPFTLS